jgi:hypothetical protein
MFYGFKKEQIEALKTDHLGLKCKFIYKKVDINRAINEKLNCQVF